MRRIAIAASLLLLHYSLGCRKPATDVRSEYSPALQSIIDEAKSGTRLPIRVEIVTPEPGSPDDYLGRTFFRDNEIVVNVTTGSSKDYDEAMRGHEYYHIILHNKGFVSKTWVPPFYQLDNLTPEASRAVLNNLQINIPSCFLDDLIDRETSKLGLKPEVINERSERSTRRLAERAVLAPAPALRTQPTVQKAMALGLFCLAIRKRTFSMDEIEHAVGAMNPNIVIQERQLVNEFGNAHCEVNDPKTCYQETLRLRDAVGINGIVKLLNPDTGKLE